MLTAFFCGDGEPCVDWEEEMTEIIVVTAWRGNHFSKYGDSTLSTEVEIIASAKPNFLALRLYNARLQSLS